VSLFAVRIEAISVARSPRPLLLSRLGLGHFGGMLPRRQVQRRGGPRLHRGSRDGKGVIPARGPYGRLVAPVR
jgi:hypothetical protein